MPLLVLALVLFVATQAPQLPMDALASGRAMLAALTGREFAAIEARFTDEMKAALPPGRVAAMWASLLLRGGAYKACAPDSRVRSIGGKQMVITACDFERMTVDIQFALDAEGRIAGMALRPGPAAARPLVLPPYANAAAYTEEAITIGDTWALPGTLTIPVGAGPFPAVVLVHGSGPNDRDETAGANTPFRDLALGLASRGIAVLRYDKRSKVHGAKLAALKSGTVREEVVDDAGTAIDALGARARIDPARIVVLGHSLGGMLIPRIMQANASLAGGIVLAGPARPIAEVIAAQARHLALLDGAISADEQAQIDAALAAGAALQRLTAADAEAGTVVFNAPAAYWLDLRGYDPPAAAATLMVPLLVLQGERDFQVTMADFERWQRALAGRPSVTFRSYPALNHLFIAGRGPGTIEEYQTPGHVAPEVVDDIAAWIRSVPPRKR